MLTETEMALFQVLDEARIHPDWTKEELLDYMRSIVDQLGKID